MPIIRQLVLPSIINLALVGAVFCQEHESKIRKVEDTVVYQFLADGRLQSTTKREMVLDIKPAHLILVDTALLDSLGLAQQKAMTELANELTDKAKKLRRRIYEQPRSNGEILKEWNKYLEDLDQKASRHLSIVEQTKLDNYVDADKFFRLGYVEFVKKETKTQVVSDDFLDRSELTNKLREIELEVWETLLKGVDSSTQVEIESILKSGLPGRTPAITTFWDSLNRLAADSDSKPITEEKGNPVFQLRSGRLVVSGSLPAPGVQDQLVVLSQIGIERRDHPEISEAVREVFAMQLEISREHTSERRRIEDSNIGKSVRSELNELAEKYNKKLETQSAQVINKLPSDVVRQLKFSNVIMEYQRRGVEASFLSKQNRDKFEFPLDDKDRQILSKNAQRARELLEDRVFEFVRDTLQQPLSRHFASDDPKIRWLQQKYPSHIPPVELIISWCGFKGNER